MTYSCPECNGHVEFDGDYSGESFGCPHCQREVRFVAIPPPVIPCAESAVELLRPGLAELAGSDQPPQVVAACLTQLQNYLTRQEEVLAVAIQSRVMAVTVKPDIVAATNRRMIVLRRGLFSCQMMDALWIDVADVRVEETLTGGCVTIQRTNGSQIVIDKLNKEAARKLYRFCQEKEELMRVARHALNLQTAAAGAARINVNVDARDGRR